jgi:TonB-linked SusC/RagA family outer membrane protein
MRRIFVLTLCLLACWGAMAQTRQLSGVVVEAKSNKGIISATVKVKGQPNSTTTDADGRFSLAVPSGRITLEVTSIGFANLDYVVEANANSVTITLSESAKQLDEVVVTALGIKKERRRVGYAVDEVKGDLLTRAREINLGNALAGRVAGVNVSSTATGPAGSSRVVIRGATSGSTNNQPLYVVNGLPMDNTQLGSAGMWGGFDAGDGLSSINPDDIESITVLKGSAASALYGSRGANGVILITTKSGKNQGGLGIEFSTTYTAERPVKTTDWQYEYGSGAWSPTLSRYVKPANLQAARDNAFLSWGEKLDGSSVIGLDGEMHPYSAQKDNMKNFYRTGSTWSNTLAVTGGKEAFNFRFSAGSTKNNAIVPNSGFDRTNLTFASNSKPNKNIEVDFNLQYIREEGKNRTFLSDAPKNPNYSVQALATSIDVRTLDPGYDESGAESPHFGGNVFTQTPYFAVNKVQNNDRRDRFIGSTYLQYNFLNNFFARGRIGIDHYNVERTDIEPTGIAYRPRGGMSESQTVRSEINTEFMLGYNKDFNDISVSAFAGANRQMNRGKGYGTGGSDFNIPYFYSVRNLATRWFDNTFSESRVNSIFGSVDVSYKNYLFVSVTGRNDWFSTLSTKDNSIFYPSVSAGFIFTEALSAPSWMNYGKLRASYANVGGGSPDPYSLVLTYGLTGQGYGGVPLMRTGPDGLPNSTLKPFNVRTLEFGFETRLFQNRLGIDVSYYDKQTTNDIVRVTISQASGYNDALVNVGEISNKGIELQLTGTPVRVKDFGWNVIYNFAYNKNKLIKLADGLATRELDQNRDQNAFIFLEEGQPFGVIKAYTFRRNDKGQVVYNPDGTAVRGDIKTVGNGVHPYVMGLTNTFSYKAFSLSVLIDGKFGGDLFSSTNYVGYRLGLHKGTLEGREGGVAVSGVDANGNPVNTNLNAQTYWRAWAAAGPEQFVYDASFVKLRSLTLTYALPEKLISRTPIKGLSISLVARNLAILYNNVPNVDPESTYTNSNAQGLERFGVPLTRSMGANLQIRF